MSGRETAVAAKLSVEEFEVYLRGVERALDALLPVLEGAMQRLEDRGDASVIVGPFSALVYLQSFRERLGVLSACRGFDPRHDAAYNVASLLLAHAGEYAKAFAAMVADASQCDVSHANGGEQ